MEQDLTGSDGGTQSPGGGISDGSVPEEEDPYGGSLSCRRAARKLRARWQLFSWRGKRVDHLSRRVARSNNI